MISREWTRCFGDVPPLGFICRIRFLDRWLRIHSLPDSKRYADEEWEYVEMIRRHNEVATQVLGVDDVCILSMGKPCGQSEHAVQLDEESWMTFSFARIRWQPSGFDRIIRDVADEALFSVMFFNPARASIYAPYDGGADLVFSSAEQVAPAKKKWTDWLSIHPSGM